MPYYQKQTKQLLTPVLDNNIIEFQFFNWNSKKDYIYVGITKLLENVGEHDTLIAYETNVIDLSKVRTDLESFNLMFESRDEEKKSSCSFRKYENTPLVVVCWVNDGVFWLKEIEEEIILNDINIKYNFRIQTVKNIKKNNW